MNPGFIEAWEPDPEQYQQLGPNATHHKETNQQLINLI